MRVQVRQPSGEEGVVPSVCLQIVSPDLHSMERVQLARTHAFQRWRHVLHAALLVALRLYMSALSSSSTSSSSTAKQEDAGAAATGQRERESPKEKRLHGERVKEKDNIQIKIDGAAPSSSSARSADKANANVKEGRGQELSRFLFDLDAFLQTVLASRAGAQNQNPNQNGHRAPAKEQVLKSLDTSNINGNDDMEEVVALCRQLRQHCLRALTASCSQSRTMGSASGSGNGSVNEEAKEVARLRLTLAQLSDMSKLLATLKVVLLSNVLLLSVLCLSRRG